MRALSIRQPWAFAIVMGFKLVENRTWQTDVRGRILVHAGKAEEIAAVEWVLRKCADQGHPRGDVTFPQLLTAYHTFGATGAIVGETSIVDCSTADRSPWFNGPWGFYLDPVLTLPVWPVPWKGALGFFEVPIAENEDAPGVELRWPSTVGWWELCK